LQSATASFAVPKSVMKTMVAGDAGRTADGSDVGLAESLAAGAFAQPANQKEHASAQRIAGSRAVRRNSLARIAKIIMAPAMSRHYTQSGGGTEVSQ
jgi:uncharacterized protein YdbL (DUF1318 family)